MGPVSRPTVVRWCPVQRPRGCTVAAPPPPPPLPPSYSRHIPLLPPTIAFSVSTALLPLSPAGADDPPPSPHPESNGVCCQQTEPCVVTERERRAVTPGTSQPPHNQQPPLSLQFTFTILRLTNLPPKHHQRQTSIDKKGILRSKLPNGSTTLFSSFCSIFSNP